MTPSVIAVYVGLLLVVFGAFSWLFLLIRGIGNSNDNEPPIVIVGFGFRVSTRFPAIAIMGIGVIILLISKIIPTPVDPVRPEITFKEYHSDALGVTFKIPLGILVIDDTQRNQLRLILRDTKGQPLVKIFRKKPFEVNDPRQAQQVESKLLIERGYTITYQAPEKEWGEWYVLSGVLNDNIFYYKRWFLKDNVLSLEFEYPREMSNTFETTINALTRDMTFSRSIPTIAQ